MKYLLLLSLSLIMYNVNAQDWTTEELEVLEHYNLNQNDHRGFVFKQSSPDCLESYSNITDGIESIFQTLKMQDVNEICIEEENNQYFNKVIDIHSLVELYLSLKN